MSSETARIEAFSDGVFAIGITLLILEIKPPSHDGNLAMQLVHLWPSFLAFLTSFMNIGVMWMNHHRLFNTIHRSDDTLLGLNLLLLLGITWIPFPTALLAEHLLEPSGRTAAFTYAGSFLFIAIVFNLLWRYASHNRRLIGHDVEHKHVESITKQYAFGPLFYIVIALIALWNTTACLIASLLLAVYFALPPRIATRHS